MYMLVLCLYEDFKVISQKWGACCLPPAFGGRESFSSPENEKLHFKAIHLSKGDTGMQGNNEHNHIHSHVHEHEHRHGDLIHTHEHAHAHKHQHSHNGESHIHAHAAHEYEIHDHSHAGE